MLRTHLEAVLQVICEFELKKDSLLREAGEHFW